MATQTQATHRPTKSAIAPIIAVAALIVFVVNGLLALLSVAVSIWLRALVSKARRFRLSLIMLLVGGALFAGGAGMRVYAQAVQAVTERQLLVARPTSPAEIKSPPNAFIPADGPPTEIRLPGLRLWNALEPVSQKVSWTNGQIDVAWDVADAGWHAPSGWPGYGGNVVVAGHSPSRDPKTWSRSVFRQLAYLVPGNRIEVTAGNRVYTYEVARTFAIAERDADTPEAAAWIERGTAERLTLITCWPPHTAAYRVVVVAVPVSTQPGGKS